MGKTVFITGGASGLGKTIAEEFAKEEYNLIIGYYSNKEAAFNLKEQLEEQYNIDIEVIYCDLKEEESMKTSINDVIKKFHHIDVLVNNGAICIDTLYEDKTKENFMKTLEVNLVGTFLISRIIGDQMYEQQSGSIINIASTNGIDKYFPMSLDYDASKAGLLSLTHNLALQYAPYIRVNAVAPGWVKTEKEIQGLDEEYIKTEEEKIFLKRFGEPVEIANIIKFLASDQASYINNTIIRVDGGVYS